MRSVVVWTDRQGAQEDGSNSRHGRALDDRHAIRDAAGTLRQLPAITFGIYVRACRWHR
jgi:hypothetical protein